ncbi:hypothetical protein M427DRAFT_39573 [Gonapodya prolifera JEL478]|uniref:Uncharacterized protein n=1 Tax=Gonapodya prolifera (strain JEL478) TaxID=1344416 RepID=A0A138ZXB3_GONPJ|nr:hypothetical protein M427DRAFT_39573 [Gonapodya prolifera JEL478]|eukprot:KXS09091.1 hypothetical protein M427DRAFT_39573 [Gonapodya prolifera JEL478]
MPGPDPTPLDLRHLKILNHPLDIFNPWDPCTSLQKYHAFISAVDDYPNVPDSIRNSICLAHPNAATLTITTWKKSLDVAYFPPDPHPNPQDQISLRNLWYHFLDSLPQHVRFYVTLLGITNLANFTSDKIALVESNLNNILSTPPVPVASVARVNFQLPHLEPAPSTISKLESAIDQLVQQVAALSATPRPQQPAYQHIPLAPPGPAPPIHADAPPPFTTGCGWCGNTRHTTATHQDSRYLPGGPQHQQHFSVPATQHLHTSSHHQQLGICMLDEQKSSGDPPLVQLILTPSTATSPLDLDTTTAIESDPGNLLDDSAPSTAILDSPPDSPVVDAFDTLSFLHPSIFSLPLHSPPLNTPSYSSGKQQDSLPPPPPDPFTTLPIAAMKFTPTPTTTPPSCQTQLLCPVSLSSMPANSLDLSACLDTGSPSNLLDSAYLPSGTLLQPIPPDEPPLQAHGGKPLQLLSAVTLSLIFCEDPTKHPFLTTLIIGKNIAQPLLLGTPFLTKHHTIVSLFPTFSTVRLQDGDTSITVAGYTTPPPPSTPNFPRLPLYTTSAITIPPHTIQHAFRVLANYHLATANFNAPCSPTTLASDPGDSPEIPPNVLQRIVDLSLRNPISSVTPTGNTNTPYTVPLTKPPADAPWTRNPPPDFEEHLTAKDVTKQIPSINLTSTTPRLTKDQFHCLASLLLHYRDRFTATTADLGQSCFPPAHVPLDTTDPIVGCCYCHTDIH